MEPNQEVKIVEGLFNGKEGIFKKKNGSNWVVEIDGKPRYITPKFITPATKPHESSSQEDSDTNQEQIRPPSPELAQHAGRVKVFQERKVCNKQEVLEPGVKVPEKDQKVKMTPGIYKDQEGKLKQENIIHATTTPTQSPVAEKPVAKVCAQQPKDSTAKLAFKTEEPALSGWTPYRKVEKELKEAQVLDRRLNHYAEEINEMERLGNFQPVNIKLDLHQEPYSSLKFQPTTCEFTLNYQTGMLQHLRQTVQKEGLVITIPSKNRSGVDQRTRKKITHNQGNLQLNLPENCPHTVLIFIEAQEHKMYCKAVANSKNHFLVLLPQEWDGRGVPMAREAILRSMQGLQEEIPQFTEFYQLDDDIDLIEEDVGNEGRNLQEIPIEAALFRLREIMNIQKAAIVSAQPGRSGRFPPCKYEHYRSGRCEKVLVVNLALCKQVSYVPQEWLRMTPDEWDEIIYDKDSSEVQQKFFQGEDFRICYLLAKNGYSQCWLCSYLCVKELKLESQAGTIETKRLSSEHQNQSTFTSRCKSSNRNNR